MCTGLSECGCAFMDIIVRLICGKFSLECMLTIFVKSEFHVPRDHTLVLSLLYEKPRLQRVIASMTTPQMISAIFLMQSHPHDDVLGTCCYTCMANAMAGRRLGGLAHTSYSQNTKLDAAAKLDTRGVCVTLYTSFSR